MRLKKTIPIEYKYVIFMYDLSLIHIVVLNSKIVII